MITKLLLNESGETGIYYDEKGQPMLGSAQVRDPKEKQSCCTLKKESPNHSILNSQVDVQENTLAHLKDFWANDIPSGALALKQGGCSLERFLYT
jgi:hypothetical protein